VRTYSSATYEPTHTRRMLRRALITSTVGTSIEYFDFALYGLAAVTIGQAFFPSHDALASTLAAFVTFGAGFLARPVGAAIFGHVGDRIGRKATLIVTLTLTGTATFLMGLVPTYAEIGIWGGVVVVLLRLLQGLGLGGEWGGAVLLTVEWGNRGKRGFLGAWPQFGIPIGVAMGISAMLASTELVHDSYWAWRMPFLASIVLIVVGLYLRLGVLESPVFAGLLERRRIEQRPVVEVLRKHWRDVVLVCLLGAGEQTPTLIFTTFVLAYGTLLLRLPEKTMLHYSLFYNLLAAALVPVMGLLSDHIGRKRLYLMGAGALALWTIPFWHLLSTKEMGAMSLAFAVAALAWSAMAGPLAALCAETFTGRMRYSGASIGYQLSAITSGGPAAVVATFLLETYRTSYAVAVYLIVCLLVSFGAALLVRDRSRQDLSVEYDERAASSPSTRSLPAPLRF